MKIDDLKIGDIVLLENQNDGDWAISRVKIKEPNFVKFSDILCENDF